MPNFNKAASWFKRLIGKGANTDIAPELFPEGFYEDGLNIRPASIDGNVGGVEAVRGEVLFYPIGNPPGVLDPSGYVLIGSDSVNGRLIEFWCHPDNTGNPPIVRVDGVIVAQSSNIPYTADRPLQIAVADRCRSGVVYPADHQSIPLYWDILAMELALTAGSQAYFEFYNTQINSVILSAPFEFPRHITNTAVTQGLPPGQYEYALRYESVQGDKTNIGPWTPLISVGVVQDFAWNGTSIPGARTSGGESALGVPGSQATELEWNIYNTQEYSYVELIRRAFNSGEGLNGPGVIEVVGRFELLPGEFRHMTFQDPRDSNFTDDVPPDLVADRSIYITAPKSVEFADSRLTYGNFTANQSVYQADFRLNNDGQAFVPITEKLTTLVSGIDENSGYTDPYNQTYKKSFMRGEKYGLCVQFWDQTLLKPFAIPIPGTEDGGYQFPNRRDRKTGDSITYSDGTVFAATTDCQSDNPVGSTFEAFQQGSYKKGTDNFINVMTSRGPYDPWTPISSVDQNISGHTWSPVSSRYSPAGGSATEQGYIWNPRYHALGACLYGVNVPGGVNGFTIGRSSPANRVVCQGMATYVLRPSTTTAGLTPKDSRVLRFVSNDILGGFLSQDVMDDLAENPNKFEIQFVSPLGFFSEPYGCMVPYLNNPQLSRTGYWLDQLSYAGIQHEEGQVNVGDPGPGGMAYQVGPDGGDGAPPGNYVGYSAWRSLNRPPPAQTVPPSDSSYSYWNQVISGQPNNGNTPMNVESFTFSNNGRARYIDISTEIVYGGTTTAPGFNFSDIATRDFHQPWYTVNIIRKGAIVPDNEIGYISTGTTIKMSACVGISDGSQDQSYRLINERWEDVLGFLQTDQRYVYVSQSEGMESAWICYTNNGSFNPLTVYADIAANGFWLNPIDGVRVMGVYFVQRLGRETTLVFGRWGSLPIPAPVLGDRIIVKYNPLAPIKVFGGDATIGPCVNSIFDSRAIWVGDEQDGADGAISSAPTLRIAQTPLPYPGFAFNLNYQIPRDSNTVLTLGPGPDQRVEKIESIRQWCVMFDGEVRSNHPMNLAGNATEALFPQAHYVITPFMDFTGGPNGTDINGFHPQWSLDYPEWWATLKGYGGIRFYQDNRPVNANYWKQPLPEFLIFNPVFAQPRIDYCNAMAASLERIAEQQNTPGFQTFLASNVKFLSEENGEIKYIASSLGNAGRNMYAWCQSGVARVLTNKNILTGASGEQISTQSISNYWGDEMWVSRDIGVPDQMWRLMARGHAPTGTGYADSFFWPDRNGFYRMTGDSISDISRGRYYNKLKGVLGSFPDNYTPQTTAFYDKVHNEPWFSMGQYILQSGLISPAKLFAFSAQQNEWIGEYSYAFDGFTMNGPSAYGHRDLQTYLLNSGYTIGPGTRVAYVTVPMVGTPGILKEFCRWAITGTRPDQVEILDQDHNIICRQNEAIAALVNPTEAQYWVLRYRNGWEQWASAILASVNAQRPRPQGDYFYLRCTWNTEGDKRATALSAQFQDIK